MRCINDVPLVHTSQKRWLVRLSSNQELHIMANSSEEQGRSDKGRGLLPNPNGGPRYQGGYNGS